MSTAFGLGIGDRLSGSGMDVKVATWTQVDGARPTVGEMKVFEDGFIPAHLNVIAGTKGQIFIAVDADYDYSTFDPCLQRKPRPFHGKLLCSCAWRYTCTPEGELEIGNGAAKPSDFSDELQLKIESVESNAKPIYGIDPYVKIIVRPYYSGPGVGQGPGMSLGQFSIWDCYGGGSSGGLVCKRGQRSKGFGEGVLVSLHVVGAQKAVKP